MDITLITIGKTSIPYIAKGIEEYTGRLKRYTPYEIKTLPDLKNARKLTEAQQKEGEGKIILDSLSPPISLFFLMREGVSTNQLNLPPFCRKKCLPD